ncbi:MAG: tRNA dihydrouridine synthase DusB [Candidatus Edwardsbacteria bacterium]|nr:tRNA dihydrouridine synthase DusB [Candidatus Edwardsbacteria bacterium]MBU1576182.1 tRNA dihydrouridine synthase DusB [Candidatus Edwardsbacteria bacterium]MBU2463297.1 tRNA dihydrouridine synthase DusB [Candidatus Edwardsbacteria bacterium]MBU2594237.1 tRNA dihydrouridine synthase DusB [Candidatus Edwardsbacteria bacterium]
MTKIFDPNILKGRAVLAPMAGITDSAFRLICRRYGAALVYSEMISAEALSRGHSKTIKMLSFREEERPIAVQLFGTRPLAFAESVERLERDIQPDFYDLNFGCPAPKIVKNGGGSALLKFPEKIAEIARAVINVAKRPVLAKIRSGWEVGSENALEVAKLLEDCGVSAIAVHGRTRSQMFSGKADWNIISKIKQQAKIPVIGNGDVTSGAEALRMIEQTGCDLVMVGRAALGNPFLFADINAALNTEGSMQNSEVQPASWQERMQVVKEHIAMSVADKGELRGIREMRKHLGWYIKGIPGAAALRQELMHAETEVEVLKLLENIGHEKGVDE